MVGMAHRRACQTRTESFCVRTCNARRPAHSTRPEQTWRDVVMRSIWFAVGAACALFGCVESDPVTQDGVIAELERPTSDGTAYTFRFSVVDDVIAKEVYTPAGHAPPVDDECALDTLLRVAPDDAVV